MSKKRNDLQVDYTPYMILGIALTFVVSIIIIPMVVHYIATYGLSFDGLGTNTMAHRDAVYSIMMLVILIGPIGTGLWTLLLYRSSIQQKKDGES